jgi:phosphohistidine phosphatase
MRRLYLLRHAKSSLGSPSLDDFDRPLNARGQQAATAMANHFRQRGIRPDLVLCSPATRTRETWALVSEGLPVGAKVIAPPPLYGASLKALIDVISSTPGDGADILVIGHNPSIQELALWLTTGASTARKHMRTNYPPAALATIHINTEDWSCLSAGIGSLEDFVTPSDLDYSLPN